MSNITKLEAEFGVSRVMPRVVRNGSTSDYVYLPNNDGKNMSITFGAGTVQRFIGAKKRMSVFVRPDINSIVFYPCDDGEFTISKSNSYAATISANSLMKAYLPKNVKMGRYEPEARLVGDMRCFQIRYAVN